MDKASRSSYYQSFFVIVEAEKLSKSPQIIKLKDNESGLKTYPLIMNLLFHLLSPKPENVKRRNNSLSRKNAHV